MQKTIWEHIRNTISSDYASIDVPINYIEPTTMLQRLVEDLEYFDLVDKAESAPTEELRNVYIAAFAATPYNSAQYRNFKPMNPVLGETYEIHNEYVQLICEQVNDSPNISAMFAQSDFFEYRSQTSFKTVFGGIHLDIYPQGNSYLKLKNIGEEFEWNRLTISTYNLIIGTPFCDFHGEIKIQNKTTGWVSTIVFQKKEFTKRVRNYDISGQLTDSQGQVKGVYSGRWDQYIYYTPQNSEPIMIWNRRIMPANHEFYYYFTHFALQLNYIDEELEKKIPLTDSRRRLDIRALENQEEKLAQEERDKILWKEKEMKKKLDMENYKPRWFDQAGEEYIFNKKYWEEKEKGFPEVKSFLF